MKRNTRELALGMYLEAVTNRFEDLRALSACPRPILPLEVSKATLQFPTYYLRLVLVKTALQLCEPARASRVLGGLPISVDEGMMTRRLLCLAQELVRQPSKAVSDEAWRQGNVELLAGFRQVYALFRQEIDEAIRLYRRRSSGIDCRLDDKETVRALEAVPMLKEEPVFSKFLQSLWAELDQRDDERGVRLHYLRVILRDVSPHFRTPFTPTALEQVGRLVYPNLF